MLNHYLVLAVKVLLRRKFFTFISLFGISFTLLVLMTATAGLNAPGGTGGIIIDNTQSGGGSQIYYSTLTSPGNAVQASQVGLQ